MPRRCGLHSRRRRARAHPRARGQCIVAIRAAYGRLEPRFGYAQGCPHRARRTAALSIQQPDNRAGRLSRHAHRLALGGHMERRAVVGGSLLAGLSTLMSPHSAEAASAAADDLAGVSYSIDQLRKTVESQFANVYTAKWHGVARIREQQHIWMKSTQKYPDFIEIGIDVWDNIYDWHVVHQQPVNMTRMSDGRYSMVFMFTTLLLRPDQAADFVGYSFDADTARRTR